MNKHIIQTITFLLFLLLTMAGSAVAENMHVGHSMDMTEPMPPPSHQGMATIRETTVDNYYLIYNLIDMRERMKGMENMPPMENTHHLMVYIHSPENKTVGDASVGYLITAPDGEKQKVMTMGMGDGYGADINLGKTGTYIISVKAVFDDTDLRDSFEYEIN